MADARAGKHVALESIWAAGRGLRVAHIGATRSPEKWACLATARRGHLRVSPHFYNDETEINRVIDVLGYH